MTTGKPAVCSAAVSRCRRGKDADTSDFRHMQICPTAANAAGYFSLPCVKGGGTAYAVTEGLSHYYFHNNLSVAFGTGSPTQGSLRCGGTVRRQKLLLNHLVSRWFSENQ